MICGEATAITHKIVKWILDMELAESLNNNMNAGFVMQNIYRRQQVKILLSGAVKLAAENYDAINVKETGYITNNQPYY